MKINQCNHKWKIIDKGFHKQGFIFKSKIKMYTLQCKICGDIENAYGIDYEEKSK